MNNNTIIDEILYSKEFRVSTKEATENMLFLQWILDIVCLTQALNEDYNRWYQQLFYVKLVGIFEHIEKDELPSNDTYIQNVKQCVNEIYENLTDDEYIYIVYRRHGVAHPLQNKYDIYNSFGVKYDKIRGVLIKGLEQQLSREDMVKAINKVDDDKSFDIEIVKRLSPIIQKLNIGLRAQFTQAAIVSGAIYNPSIYTLLSD